MALSVRRQGGVVVEYAGEGVILDPTSEDLPYPSIVTHAHSDHASAFRFSGIQKYSTPQTYRLLERLGWRRAGDWHPISIGERFKVGDMEIRTHNAGHVLGSITVEITSPEGTVLYTGDFNVEESYTMQPARPVSCDILVIETTFGSPAFSFPRRSEVAIEMVKWAVLDVIPRGRVPAFKTDSIGNAQEIISIFNRLTKLPVVASPTVARASDVYREYGHRLDYIEADSKEGRELLESGRCVYVTPKGSRPSSKRLELSLASGWAALFRKGGRAFALSDHTDFKGLLSFIKGCRPKRVLTFHGGPITKGFTEYVRRRLGLEAKPLTNMEETISGTVLGEEGRLKACRTQLLSLIRIPGFTYSISWLMKEMARRGFTRREAERALGRLVEEGILQPEGPDMKLREP
ncbi:MAG: MBL fold metallo-hydrolase [Candidatus Bathyarchaeia archaeon]